MTITGKSGRPVGLPKTGGRKKGTPNKATQTIAEKLEGLGCDPIIELAKIGMSEKTPIELRVRCLSEIAPYLYPKRKPADALADETYIYSVNTNLDTSLGGCDERDQNNHGA
jgi:hypothetical protein